MVKTLVQVVRGTHRILGQRGFSCIRWLWDTWAPQGDFKSLGGQTISREVHSDQLDKDFRNKPVRLICELVLYTL